MRIHPSITLKEVAEKFGSSFAGPDNLEISGINEIHKVEKGDLTFCDAEKHMKRALSSPASVIIVHKKMAAPQGKGLIFADDPFTLYNSLAKQYRPFIAASGNIADDAVIGQGCAISPGVIIGNRVVIGKDCILHPNVVIYDDAVIGDRAEIHANTTIGAHAYYYKFRNGPSGRTYEKMHSCGKVIIGADVEIGAGCTIDKGVSGATIIGKGSKLDGQVHIGHGVVIGEHCLLAAQVGVGGKTIIGNRAIFWGQVGIQKSLVIGDDVEVFAQSGVTRNLKSGQKYFGSPAIDARRKMKEIAASHYLPEIWANLREKK